MVADAGYDAVTKVTIIPGRTARAASRFTPNEDRMESGLYSYKYLGPVAASGAAAEELAFGKEEVTTGASNDLQQGPALVEEDDGRESSRGTLTSRSIFLKTAKFAPLSGTTAEKCDSDPGVASAAPTRT
ncbi:metalloendopeptidase [Aureococcus anophagefferens]|nr:metalloendopeptidase [Aureococcus anophagefferens]